MARFRAVALNAAGETTRTVIEATDEQAAIAVLRRQKQIPMRVEPERSGGVARFLSIEIGGGGGLGAEQVTTITRELATMLGAGQDLDRSLRFLTEISASAKTKRVLEAVRDRVRDGAPLAAALAEHPRVFSRLYVGLVRAGEAGGTLPDTLERLATLMERQRSLRATVRSALIYPTILLVAAIASVVLLLTHVLPEFVPLFQQNGVALPASTQFLIDAGAFLGTYGIFLLLLVVAGGFALREAWRRPQPRLVLDRLLLRVPITGALTRDIMAAQLCRTLGTLVLNGVSLIAALGIARDAVTNRVAMEAIERATVVAKGGGGLSGPLGASGVFPQRTIYLLRLGEETAQLGNMALRAAEIHEERTRINTQRLVSLLTPGITIVMGGVIAGIVSSLLLAMLSLNNLAQQ